MPRPELAVLPEIVVEHGRAELAHRRVCDGVLREPHALRHAERDRARLLAAGRLRGSVGDRRAERVVGVVHEDGLGRRCKRAHDAVLDAVDLAAAVELVAEQVQQQHIGGAKLRGHLRKPQLVAFEHAPIGLLRVEQRRRHAGIEVRSRAVAHHPRPRTLEHVGEQVRHRGLAVGAHHHDRSPGKLPAEVGQKTRVDVECDLPWEISRWPAENMLESEGRQSAYATCGGKPDSHEASFANEKRADAWPTRAIICLEVYRPKTRRAQR